MNVQPDFLLTQAERLAIEVSLPPDAGQAEYIHALLLAQMRKVVEWGLGICPKHNLVGSVPKCRFECYLCRAQLKKELDVSG